MALTGRPSGAEALRDPTVVALAGRCEFPTSPNTLNCAFSGGPDSSALLALARAAGLAVTAHHVDHGLRPSSSAEAEQAARIAEQLGCRFELHRVVVPSGPNLEARARAARRAVLPSDAATGHTLDDQAETVLIRLMRGSGATGLTGIASGPRHPLLGLRRADTERVCQIVGIDPVRDPSNGTPSDSGSSDCIAADGDDASPFATQWRARVRHEVVPLLAEISQRDPVPILARAAALLGDDDTFLNELAEGLDPTDCRSLREAPVALARRAVRGWLSVNGYPPDATAIERVLSVASGEAVACEIAGQRRIVRSAGRLRVVEPGQ